MKKMILCSVLVTSLFAWNKTYNVHVRHASPSAVCMVRHSDSKVESNCAQRYMAVTGCLKLKNTRYNEEALLCVKQSQGVFESQLRNVFDNI